MRATPTPHAELDECFVGKLLLHYALSKAECKDQVSTQSDDAWTSQHAACLQSLAPSNVTPPTLPDFRLEVTHATRPTSPRGGAARRHDAILRRMVLRRRGGSQRRDWCDGSRGCGGCEGTRGTDGGHWDDGTRGSSRQAGTNFLRAIMLKLKARAPACEPPALDENSRQPSLPVSRSVDRCSAAARTSLM